VILKTRRTNLRRLANEELDVLVIGGGITGSGILRDCAQRGLSCVLLEKGDFSSGTSSKSGKLIHGGLRYLKNLQLSLVWESCTERRHLLDTLAPHIVKPVQFFIPFYRGSLVPRWMAAVGLLAYEILSGFKSPGPFKVLGPQKMLEIFPNLERIGLVGGVSYFDCSCNDARLTLETLKAAVSHGAHTHSYCEVLNLERQDGVFTVKFKDCLDGDSQDLSLRAKTVVSAAGAWADQLQSMAKEELFNLKMTSGIHLILEKNRLNLPFTMSVESGEDNRVIYLVPHEHYLLIGTTDRFVEPKPDEISISKRDVSYLLNLVNRYFPEAKLSADDVQSAFVGVRPLVGSADGKSESELPRDYEIRSNHNGYIAVTGGKLTTYRHMAQKVVDLLVHDFFPDFAFKPCSSISPISGGEMMSDKYGIQEEIKLSQEHLQIIQSRYGSNVSIVGAHICAAEDGAERISDDIPYLWGEIDYFVHMEQALSLSDVLIRRSEIFFIQPLLPDSLLRKIALRMSKLLGTDENWVDREIELYLREIQKTLGAITVINA
jgi:glycerol-3-phosphate dehydrogenase